MSLQTRRQGAAIVAKKR